MKVHELIEELQKLPPEADVFRDQDGTYTPAEAPILDTKLRKDGVLFDLYMRDSIVSGFHEEEVVIL